MRSILVFGAGKSATALIDYLLEQAVNQEWKILVCDANLALATDKIAGRPNGEAICINVSDAPERKELIQRADVVISLLPPDLHLSVALDCLQLQKHLLTASYVSPELRDLQHKVKESGILFLCEMGLDPGIDHMSAMKIIDGIRDEGGQITSFISHCGGLVAPESDDNPWHYKISWNSRNILMAGKSGARYKVNGNIEKLPYEQLFDPGRGIQVDDLGYVSYYPNRDSLDYMELYQLGSADTFMRTTLRYPEFCFGWKNIIELKLTDEHQFFNSDGLSVKQFFREHLARFNSPGLLEQKIAGKISATREILENLKSFRENVESSGPDGLTGDMLVVGGEGNLESVSYKELKKSAGLEALHQLHETKMLVEQFDYLELDSEQEINLGVCTAIDVLQWILEKKLALHPGDKDMAVMLHEVEYITQSRERKKIESLLIVKGETILQTAMAKTVGLPLGIAAKLIMEGKITLTGLHIPIHKEIYVPVLDELKNSGISFKEKTESRDAT